MSRRQRIPVSSSYEPVTDNPSIGNANYNRFRVLDNDELDRDRGRGRSNRRGKRRQFASQDRQSVLPTAAAGQLSKTISTESLACIASDSRGRGNRGNGRGRGRGGGRNRGRGGMDISDGLQIPLSQQRSFGGSTQSLDGSKSSVQNDASNRNSETHRGRSRGGRSRGRGQDVSGLDNRETEGSYDGGSSKRRGHCMNYTKLDTLLSNEPSDIILSLVEPRSGLRELLEKPQLEPDHLFLLLKVLSRALKSNIHPENQHCLMGTLIESNLFVVHVPMMVTALISKKDEHNVFENLNIIFRAFLRRMPVAAAEKLSGCVKLCVQIIRAQTDSTWVPEDLRKSFVGIEDGMQHVLDEKTKEAGERAKSKGLEAVVDDAPPDDFREIPVTPYIDEITTNIKPFLRKNIIDGKYKNVDHYLDVQFRLLREDFIAPLRQGINGYLNQQLSKETKKGKIREIRVYEGVQILEPICNRDGIYYEISFDIKPLQRVRWEVTRRLLPGSLVCLSADNFKTVRFATVTLRNTDKLKEGKMGVKFEGEFDEELELSKKDRSRIYVMAESQAYFEAYRHILRGLQMVSSELMPLADYIVNVQKHIEPPKYLDHNSVYDMACVLVQNSGKKYHQRIKSIVQEALRRSGTADYLHLDFLDSEPFNTSEEEEEDDEVNLGESHRSYVLDPVSWPISTDLGLDDSQRRAMHLALTSSVAIIQGPPGTGKTYIGLKIVKTLLSNRNVWKTQDSPAPILVVCLTNHALDQFLVGMLPFTSRLVRVGGRSKSESLERYNIRYIRERMRGSRLRAANIHFNSEDLQHELRVIRGKLELQKDKAHLLINRVLHENALVKLTGADRHLVRSLRDGFEDMFGINPNNQQWCPKSFLAAWLGLTFENFVFEEEIDEFYHYDEEDFQKMGPHNKPVRGQRGVIALPEAGFAEVEPLDSDDDLIEVEDEVMIEQQNRLIDEEAPEVEPLAIPVSAFAWAVQVEKLSDPMYHFPNEAIPAPMLHMYSAMGRARRVIAERELRKTECMEEGEIHQVTNAWTLPLPDRWRLYRRWVAQFRAASLAEINVLQDSYNSAARRLKEVTNGEELAILRQSDIVGMTTTGAAKYHQVLQEIGSKIVIVEEAAEVLESHVVTTLSPRTEHLILIGDHMQLRPTTAVYKLATDYNLDISLFERLIKNGVRYETLQLQHRMRPEISSLIVPLIYPNLEDHSSVRRYSNIKGLSTNMFFIKHSNREEAVVDSMTHANQFEAEFLVGLCYYLMQQGYGREQITILTTYAGQLFALRKLMTKERFEGVRVMVVDNYQGEENDIILLSFVRSNEEGKIGFLKTENRVNVALSRARQGLYCVGNFSFLASKSDFWRKLVANLERDEKIGPKLELKCQKHPDSLVQVGCGEEFRRVAPEGGCLQICKAIQACGHECQRVCHLDSHFKCTQRCPKILCSLNHQCPLLCYQPCQPCKVPVRKAFPTCVHDILLPCYRDVSEVKCKAKVKRKLESCGHEVMLECHLDPNSYKCLEIVERILLHCEHKRTVECYRDLAKIKCVEECDYRLDCGHQCPINCHPTEDEDHVDVKCNKPCQRKICELNHKCKMRCCQPCNTCQILVEKELPCGHKDKVACYQAVQAITCSKQCQRTMNCGHRCKLRCKDPCGGCEVMVERLVPNCGHLVRMKCMDNPALALCMKKCNKRLVCGHPCGNRCCDPCTKVCEHPVPAKGLCDHSTTVPCHACKNSDVMLTLYCQTPCNQLLPCEHQCKGTCGQCRQGRLHIPCREKCGRIQICGHECQTPCSEACMPCKRKCETRCVHSRCPKRCGQPCKRCWEPCPWRCRHFACQNYCGLACTRPRCNEPCHRRLSCDHLCIGLCSEKCPKLCRECNPEELTEFILFGYEEEKDARFIQLEDCGHCIEVRALDHFMDMDQETIQMKGCPRCNTTIWRSRRYGDVIRQRMGDVQKVKKRLFGSNNVLRKTMNRLQNMLAGKNNVRQHFPTECARLVKRLNQRFALHHNELAVIENQIIMLDLMVQKKERVQKMNRVAIDYFLADLKILSQRLMQNEERITEYELNQINNEIRRIFLRAATVDTENKIAQQNNAQAANSLAQANQILAHGCILTVAEEKAIEAALETALQCRGGLGISENERIQIVKAMALTSGHWYKCPNGHVYAIGDCGGANQISKCNECGARIGGQSHTLLSGNAHAGEMDGSRYAAWSEGANLANYVGL